MAQRAPKLDRDAAAGSPKAALRARPRNPLRPPLKAIREGLRFEFFAALSETYALPPRELAAAVGIAERTLARRKTEGSFSPEESDRLYRLGRIAAFAQEILGSAPKASEWLRRPNRALGGEPPLLWLDTDPGSRQVEDVLGRIAHGVAS